RSRWAGARTESRSSSGVCLVRPQAGSQAASRCFTNAPRLDCGFAKEHTAHTHVRRRLQRESLNAAGLRFRGRQPDFLAAVPSRRSAMPKKRRFIYLGSVASAVIVGLGVWSQLQQAVAKSRNKAPQYKVDPFWPKPLPSDVETNPAAATDGYRTKGPGATKPWVTGEVAGHGIDSKDHVFIVTRGPQGNLVSPETVIAHPSPSVVEFARAGNVVNSWPPNVPSAAAPWWTAPFDPIGCDGSPSCHAATRGVPQGIHGLNVDYQDNVWIAGNGVGIVQKYTHDGSTLRLQLGKHGCCDNPCAPIAACGSTSTNPFNGGTCGNTATCAAANNSQTLLKQPPRMRVDPNPDPVTGQTGSIYVPDGYGNHRVVVFDRNGKWLRHWGGVVVNSANPNATAHDRGSFASGDGGHPHCLGIGKDKYLYV